MKDSVGNFDILNLTLEEEHWWLAPRLQVGLEVNSGELKRFEAIASGNIDSASIWNVDFLFAGLALEKTIFDLPESLEPKTWMFLGAVGPVPVYASLGFDVKLKARAEVHATASFRAGKRETSDAAFGLTYHQPNVQWVNIFTFLPPEVIPFTANINAEGSLRVSLEPELEFLVYGLAGVSAGITPSAAIVFEIGTGQPLSGRLEADVNLDLGLAGPAFELLNPTPELSLSLWHDEWHLFPEQPISFIQQPQSQTVKLGGSAYFSCTVNASNSPAYQWHFNGVPMPGQNARTLLLPNVSYGHGGNYHVRVSAGGQTSNSIPATLTVTTPAPPQNMVLIPGGSFTMGDGPTNPVYVSAFYMDRYEVTKALWDDIRSWARAHGYSFGFIATGKANNHPVQTVDWYNAVVWCNARSEKEGRVPAYYTSAAQDTVYRNGTIDVQTSWVKWNTGYRLPTEAEWEKAARGGATGHRFPWSDTDDIMHSRANYYSRIAPYDTSPTRGYHPAFNDAVFPYTSPVGYFAPNGYGLYDMAGNVGEWCWDWYIGPYPSGYRIDPRGDFIGSAEGGNLRISRGGHWNTEAVGCGVAARAPGGPSVYGHSRGFRSVLP